jgi:large subunit ribosomal protein L29
MEATELRTLTPDELKGKVRQWRDELFRARFKAQGGEGRNTSIDKKLRKEIARALTVLSEKTRGVVVTKKAVAVETPSESKPAVKKTASKKKPVEKKEE